MPSSSASTSVQRKKKATEPDIAHIAPHLRRDAVEISTLSPDPANARKHPERSIESIVASLRAFGQRKHILIDAKGVTIAGAGVLEAARKIGWTHLAVMRHDDLSPAERAAYAIADNRVAELSEWDPKALSMHVGAMPPELREVLGFTEDELAELFADPDQDVQQDDIVEPLKTAVSKAGDLWVLGEHRLLCGDCTIDADVARVMAGEKASLVATDPPYLVGYDGTNHMSSGGFNKDWSNSYGVTWDDAEKNPDLYPRFLKAALAAAKDDAAWYCWHASARHVMLEQAWLAAGLLPHAQIIWSKNRPVVTRTWYMWQHEPCMMGWKKGHKPKRLKDQAILSTVWEIDTIPNGEERPDHPTPKPLEVYAIPMRQHTRTGDVIFEPFSGSGTAIVTAEQLGRRCRAIEISPLYVDVAVRRWQKLTGKDAHREGDGSTWTAAATAAGVSTD